MLHMTPADAGPSAQLYAAGVAPYDPVPPQTQPERASSLSDPNRLAPEDAFLAHSPPRRLRQSNIADGPAALNGLTAKDLHKGGLIRAVNGTHRRKDKDRGRSGSRRRKGVWKKLLWVKQSCKPLKA